MQRAIDFVKENRKILVIAALIVVLVAVIYFVGKSGSGEEQSAAASAQEKSATETKLMSILSAIDGVGNTDVMITETDGVISGVIIVCEGADRIMVRNDILNAVSTALNVDKSIIAVYTMKS